MHGVGATGCIGGGMLGGHAWVLRMRKRPWIVGLLALAVVWSAAVTGIVIARSWVVTADEVAAFAAERSLAELSADERERRLRELADMVNRLEFEERREADVRGAVRDRFREMTPAERAAYLEATLPSGMQQFMNAINEMPRDERKRLVDRALADMKSGANDPNRQRMEEEIGEEAVNTIVETGMKSFMSDASAEAKLDLQPLVEQMQVNLRRPRHGR